MISGNNGNGSTVKDKTKYTRRLPQVSQSTILSAGGQEHTGKEYKRSNSWKMLKGQSYDFKETEMLRTQERQLKSYQNQPEARPLMRE